MRVPLSCSIAAAMLAVSGSALAQAELGKAAPDYLGKIADGDQHRGSGGVSPNPQFSGEMKLVFVHDTYGSVSKAYGRTSVPQLIVVGKDGRLMQKFVGYSEEQADKIASRIQAAIAE